MSGCNPCTGIGPNGAPGGGGGGAGFTPFFQQTFSQVGATLGTLPIADLPAFGDRILIRGLTVSAFFTAGVPAGDIGEIAYAGIVQAQNGTTDAQVVMFSSSIWGLPPVPILQPTSVGYQPALAFASPGGIALGVGVVGTQVVVVGLGIAGFTTRFDVIGELYLFAGAIRLVP